MEQKEIIEKIRIYESYDSNNDEILFKNIAQLLKMRHTVASHISKTEEKLKLQIDYVEHINEHLKKLLNV